MAKLILRSENSTSCYSQYVNHKASIFSGSKKKNQQFPFNVLTFKHSIKLRISCRVKEKGREGVVDRRKEVGEFQVNKELDPNEGLTKAAANELEVGNDGKQVDFHLDWPPWKNLPKRYKLIGTTALAFVICNMDKVNLSIAIIPMSHQYGWNSSVAGLVQSSFFWGYALSQLPGGWLAKIYGGRKVLEIGVLGWSIATILVPSLAGFMPGLLASRILVGIGEGVSPSAATDMIARHVSH